MRGHHHHLRLHLHWHSWHLLRKHHHLLNRRLLLLLLLLLLLHLLKIRLTRLKSNNFWLCRRSCLRWRLSRYHILRWGWLLWHWQIILRFRRRRNSLSWAFHNLLLDLLFLKQMWYILMQIFSRHLHTWLLRNGLRIRINIDLNSITLRRNSCHNIKNIGGLILLAIFIWIYLFIIVVISFNDSRVVTLLN
jgi:hypothetical protein